MSLNKKANIEIMSMYKDCFPIFSVLNDEKRQAIILIIGEYPEKGIIVNEITERINLSRPAVSHHLKILKQAGIVGVINKGVENYYYLTLKSTVENLKRLINAIEDNCDLI